MRIPKLHELKYCYTFASGLGGRAPTIEADKTGNGQHWFTVALAITTAPSPGMLRRALSPDEQDRVKLAWGDRDDSSVNVVCSLRSGAGRSTVNILGKHFGR